ncbi:MAG: ABC transporter permease [Planctomycetota bacterium]
MLGRLRRLAGRVWQVLSPARQKLGRVWRMTTVELAKLSRQWFVWVCLAVAAWLALAGVALTPREIEGYWRRTGFDYLAQGVAAAYLLLPMMLVVLGSRSVSAEASNGTLRTVLTRPLTRAEFVLAKIAALVVLTLVFYLVTLLAAEAFAWFRAEKFRPLYPTYPGGGGREIPSQTPARELPDLAAHTVKNLSLLYLPLLSAAIFGLFISVLFNNEGVSVSVSAIAYLPYAMCAGFHPEYFKGMATTRVARWLPQYWSVEPLYKLKQFVEGYSHGFLWDTTDLARAVLVPLLFVVVFSAASVAVFARRDILV